MEQLPEAGDDEERVVDADAEADHRHEQRRDRVDVGQAGEDEEEEERRHERRQRERDRDRRRDERAEDDEQHDQRREQPEQLLRPLLDRRELRVAVELGRDAGRLDGLAHRVLDGDDRLPVLLVDDAVELRLRVGDAAVVGEGRVVERVADALDPGLVLGGLELLRLELGDDALDRLLALRGVEPLPLRRGEDEVEDAALLGCELGLDQVGRLLRVRAGDLELVLEAAADGGDEDDQAGDDSEPREDHAPRVRRARAHPPGKPARREPFVRGAPLSRRWASVGLSGLLCHGGVPLVASLRH